MKYLTIMATKGDELLAKKGDASGVTGSGKILALVIALGCLVALASM